MLKEVGVNSRIFLKAEPSNRYDKNAYKVLVWKYDKFNHVGYIQRHSAAKIAEVMQNPTNNEKYNNNSIYIVGRLKNSSGESNMFEVEILGSIYDTKSLIDRDEKIKTDSGIFGGKKKPVFDNTVKQKKRIFCGEAKGYNTYQDLDQDQDLCGFIDEQWMNKTFTVI